MSCEDPKMALGNTQFAGQAGVGMGLGNSGEKRNQYGAQQPGKCSDEAAPASMPSRPVLSLPRQSAAETTAQVKWYNPDKGFGFVELADGSGEAFLHARVLEIAGPRNLEPGVTIVARFGFGPQGKIVASIVSIDASTARPELPRARVRRARFLGRVPRQSSGTDIDAVAPDRDGIVRWFDPAKGFGFITVVGEPNGLFVHVSVLKRSGLDVLEPGQSVRVAVVEGRQGDEIGALILS